MAEERAPRMMSFVTEKEIQETKKKRQEEWEKVRKPTDPLERPEEVHDPRSLYERLKEQRDKKQEDWDNQFKFKNMIYKGLDDEEAGFLNRIASDRANYDLQMSMREREEILQYRKAIAELEEAAAVPPSTSSAIEPVPLSPTTLSDTRTLQSNKLANKQIQTKKHLASLIGSGIRRKRSSSGGRDDLEQNSSLEKKARGSSTSSEGREGEEDRMLNSEMNKPVNSSVQKDKESSITNQELEPAKGLPGLAVYSSSDEDDE